MKKGSISVVDDDSRKRRIDGIYAIECQKVNKLRENHLDSISEMCPNLSRDECVFFSELNLVERFKHRYEDMDLPDDTEPQHEPAENVSDDKDIKRIKKQLSNAENDLESKKKAIKELKDENKRLMETTNDLKKALNDRKNEPQGYSETYVNKLDAQINDLNKQIDVLKQLKTVAEKDRDDYSGKLKDAEAEISGLRETESSLKKEIEDLKRTIDGFSPSDTGTVTRISATELYSTMFEDGYYEVRLASDYTYLDIKKSDSGKANCWNHTIKLPKLNSYISFQSEQDYGTRCSNGVIRVLIHD